MLHSAPRNESYGDFEERYDDDACWRSNTIALTAYDSVMILGHAIAETMITTI